MNRPFLRALATRAGYHVYERSSHGPSPSWDWGPKPTAASNQFKSAEHAWIALENVMHDKLTDAEKLMGHAADIVRSSTEDREPPENNERIYGVVLFHKKRWWCVSFTALNGMPLKAYPLADKLTDGYADWLAAEIGDGSKPSSISDMRAAGDDAWSGEFGLVLCEDGNYAIDAHPWSAGAEPVELFASRAHIDVYSLLSAPRARPVDQGERDTGDASDDAHGRPHEGK